MVDWYGLLECPICRGPFSRVGGSLVCTDGHCFDIARQGYVNLLPGGAEPGTADTREMVAARTAFLGAGYYRPLIESIAAEVAAAVHGVPGCVIDTGAGTGEYLSAVLGSAPERIGLALDISKHAAAVAARAHPRAGAVVCDVWEPLPVRDGVAAAVMSVFSPRNAPELARVLVSGGALVVAAPTPDHLRELIEPLGMISVDPTKAERLARSLGELFALERTRRYELEISPDADDAVALVSMGPSARHTSIDEVRARAMRMGDTITATVSVDIGIWRPLVQ